MNYLSINNLTVQYDDFMVLDNFSAQFGSGLHWIQGHNGSGKSTLLKAICGINSMTSGTVKIMTHDINAHPHKAKDRISFVPDKPEVYPFMTGMQYLSFIAKIKNSSINDDLLHWLEETKLKQFNDLAFSKMSFGTRRKFTLCNLFIGDPDVILLDEPFNGLDQNTAKALYQKLSNAKKNSCILVVNHEAHLIKDIADSVTNLSLK